MEVEPVRKEGGSEGIKEGEREGGKEERKGGREGGRREEEKGKSKGTDWLVYFLNNSLWDWKSGVLTLG